MTIPVREVLSCGDREDFRRWLAAHHAMAAECWVAVKKGCVPPGAEVLSYLDAVEEALCFGRIASTNKVQDGLHLQRFSPRRRNSPWSELNKARCRRLERLGRMTELAVDPEIAAAFAANPVARMHFLRFPKLYRLVRIDTVQRDKHKDHAVFLRRLERLVRCSERGEMFGA